MRELLVELRAARIRNSDVGRSKPEPEEPSEPDVPPTPAVTLSAKAISRARALCKAPALDPKPEPSNFIEAKHALAGHWLACAGRLTLFDAFEESAGRKRNSAQGIEFTLDGHWYFLDVAKDGTLVRRPVRDMLDDHFGTIGWHAFPMDPPTGDLLFHAHKDANSMEFHTMTFASTVPALDIDGSRMMRVEEEPSTTSEP